MPSLHLSKNILSNNFLHLKKKLSYLLDDPRIKAIKIKEKRKILEN